MNKNLQDNERFFNRSAARYDNRIIQFWMKKYYRPTILDITTPGKILDVSCGTGNLLQELSKRGHQDLHGIDYSSKMVDIAQNKLGAKAIIQKADVHHLPFNEHTFNYVISTEAFHHYGDQRKALQELVRVTKKGGKVIISDINFFLKPIHWLFQKIEPGCVKVNSKKEFHSLFKEAGLTKIQQQRNFWFAIKTVGVKSS